MNGNKGIINDKFEVVIKEIQGLISFGYVLLIILGMLFESIYYGQFGINIFRYSGILDFLLVPFRRPTVLIILLGLSLFWYLYFIKLYAFLGERYPKFQNKLFDPDFGKNERFKTRIKWLVIFFVVTTTAWGYVTSKKAKENLFNKKYDLSVYYDIQGRDNVINGKLIGKNDLNIFLLDEGNRVQILPLNSGIIRIMPQD